MPESSKISRHPEHVEGSLINRLFFGLLVIAATWIITLSLFCLVLVPFVMLSVQKLSFYLIGNDKITLVVIFLYVAFMGFCGVLTATLMTPHYSRRVSSWFFVGLSLVTFSIVQMTCIRPFERHLADKPPTGVLDNPIFYYLALGCIISALTFSKKSS